MLLPFRIFLKRLAKQNALILKKSSVLFRLSVLDIVTRKLEGEICSCFNERLDAIRNQRHLAAHFSRLMSWKLLVHFAQIARVIGKLKSQLMVNQEWLCCFLFALRRMERLRPRYNTFLLILLLTN